MLLTRVAHWCKLKAWGPRLWKRIGFKKAKIALHLVKQGGGSLEATTPLEFRESGTDVPVGTAASARSNQALRCLIEASAIHTLIRQRPPTPSCRGLETLLRREQ